MHDVPVASKVLEMRNELLDEAVEMIRAAGFEPRIVRSRHWKISWIDQQGRTRLLVIAFTPGKRQARTQSRAILRRLLVS
jgi:hypothetical protein